MSGMRTIGWVLIGIGVLWLLGTVAVFLSGFATGKTDLPAALMGIMMFGAPLSVALGIAGVLLVVKGKRDDASMSDVKFERRVLDMIEARGTVTTHDMAGDLGATPAQVEDAVRDLVGKRLFTGFINWDAHRIYSEAAAHLETSTCPNCGGKLDLAGKDLAACPYCGTEIFLSGATT